MTYRSLLASTAILLAGTTSAFAQAQDCEGLVAAYAGTEGAISGDITLTNQDGTIECEFENGVLVSEEIEDDDEEEEDEEEEDDEEEEEEDDDDEGDDDEGDDDEGDDD